MRWPLERLQREFAAQLLDGDGAACSSRELLAGAQCEQRLALYRAGLEATWEKALARAYPVVRALLGAEFFAALTRRYARLHASCSGDLNDFGATFASFVSAFEQVRAVPCLADVAALEWRVHRAAFAADAEPLRRERLAAWSPQELLDARFALHPACSWLQSPFPVASLWRAHQPGSGVPEPALPEHGEWALIVRPRWTPQVLVARAGEIAALQALRDGADIDGAIAAALGAEPHFDFARAIVRWLDHTVITEPR